MGTVGYPFYNKIILLNYTRPIDLNCYDVRSYKDYRVCFFMFNYYKLIIRMSLDFLYYLIKLFFLSYLITIYNSL